MADRARARLRTVAIEDATASHSVASSRRTIKDKNRESYWWDNAGVQLQDLPPNLKDYRGEWHLAVNGLTPGYACNYLHLDRGNTRRT